MLIGATTVLLEQWPGGVLMSMTEKPFVGEFSELLEAFVEHKRTLGYKYDTTRGTLQRFSIFTLN